MKTKELLDIVKNIQQLLETNQKNGKLSRKSAKELSKAIVSLQEVMGRDGNLRIKDPVPYQDVVRVIAEVSKIFLSTFLLNESGKNDQGSP